jgi:hypothetical protein
MRPPEAFVSRGNGAALLRGLKTVVDARTAWRIFLLLTGEADPEQVEQTAAWIRQCYNRPSGSELALHAADVLLGTSGIEGIELPDGSFLSYANTGETYAGTVVHTYDEGFYWSSWGDEVERMEREQA